MLSVPVFVRLWVIKKALVPDLVIPLPPKSLPEDPESVIKPVPVPPRVSGPSETLIPELIVTACEEF